MSMSENTFGLVALVALVGAIVWDAQRKKAAPVNPTGRTSTGQAYATPTSVGEQLARGVVGLTLGWLSPTPKGVTTENARTAFRQAELQAERTAAGWVGPSQSQVFDPHEVEGWATIDSTLSAPVYNPSTDLVQNPFAANAL
jgi:hypothetical protein